MTDELLRESNKVLIVAWPGAGSKRISRLLKTGALPQLNLASKQGAKGEIEFQSSDSTINWATLTTGTHPHIHRILSRATLNPGSTSLIPTPNTGRNRPAFWNILSRHNLPVTVIGGPLSSPPEPISEAYISQRYLDLPPGKIDSIQSFIHPSNCNEQLADILLRPEDIDPALLRFLLPSFDEIPHKRDRRWQILLQHLAELYNAHNTAITLLQSENKNKSLTICLPFIERLLQTFEKFEHPSENRSYGNRIYGNVIDSALRLLDLLLNDLLKQSGPNTTLFLISTGEPPTPTNQSDTNLSSTGILFMAGPGIRPGIKTKTAQSIDFTPTLLHFLHLPINSEMEGRILSEALTASHPAQRPSIPPDPPDSQPTPQTDPPKPGTPFPITPADPIDLRLQRETHFNEGLSLLKTNRPAEALPLLFSIAAEEPENPRGPWHMAQTLSILGLPNEAFETVTSLEDNGPTAATSDLKIRIALENNGFTSANRFLTEAETAGIDPTLFSGYRGLLALIAKRPAEAETCFQQYLARDTQNALAWAGLSRSYTDLGKFPEALEAAKQAASLQPENHLTQLSLAEAAEASGDTETAALAHANALRLEPNLSPSRDGLLRLILNLPKNSRDSVLQTLSKRRKTPPATSISRKSVVAEFQQLQANFLRQKQNLRRKMAPLSGFDFKTGTPIHDSLKIILNQPNETGFKIRPPWPDELPRTLRFIENSEKLTGKIFPLIAHPQDSHHLIAAGILHIPADTQDYTRLFISIRNRNSGAKLFSSFINSFEKIAQISGIKKILLTLPESDPLNHFPLQNGFHPTSIVNWLSIPVRTDPFTKKAKTAAIAAKWVTTRSTLSVRPYHPETDLPETALILQSHNLIDLSPISTNPHTKYSTDLSFIVLENNKIVGLILSQDFGENIFVHAKAVSPSKRKQSAAINALLMDRFFQTVTRNTDFQNVENILLTGQHKNLDTTSLSKFGSGQIIENYHSYEKTIARQ